MQVEQEVRELAALPSGTELDAALERLEPGAVPNAAAIDVLQASWRQTQHVIARHLLLVAESARCTPVRDGDDPNRIQRSATARPWANTEIAAALTRTPNNVQRELDWVMVLVARLPRVMTAFWAGQIDHEKAREFVEYLAELTDTQIEQVCTELVEPAAGWTVGQLRDRLRRAIVQIDPDFTRRRYTKAFTERKVAGYLTANGTASLSARGLNPAEAAAAFDRLHGLAESIRTAGHAGPLREIEADLCVRLLDGTFTGMNRRQIIAAMSAEYASASGKEDSEPQDEVASASEPRQGVDVCAGLCTMLEMDDDPAELPGWGPIFAEQARALAARQRSAEWRFAITDDGGGLLFAGTTRLRPYPARRPDCHGGVVELEVSAAQLAELAAREDLPPLWAALITDVVVQYGDRAQSEIDAHPDDRFPRARLRQYTQARDRTCAGPGCRRPATKSDLDHTVSRGGGGRTVSGNLEPLCDLHHAMKTFGGWTLTQPEPGMFRWRSPLGRIYWTRGARATAKHRVPSSESALVLDDLPP